MLSRDNIIKLLNSDNIKKIFNNLNVEHLYLVWSYARWEQTNKSDIDLVFKEKSGSRIGGLSFIKNKLLLEKELKLKVDLVNNDFIYDDIKDFINKDKILIY